jgi:tRNA(Glu) U13 pseudouridine synthase TruD
LNKLIKNKIIINYIKSQRLGWFGHVYRMPDERMIKKVYEWKPMATISLERRKNRRENDVQNDLNIMRIRNWKDCIQD